MNITPTSINHQVPAVFFLMFVCCLEEDKIGPYKKIPKLPYYPYKVYEEILENQTKKYFSSPNPQISESLGRL